MPYSLQVYDLRHPPKMTITFCWPHEPIVERSLWEQVLISYSDK